MLEQLAAPTQVKVESTKTHQHEEEGSGLFVALTKH